MHLRAVNLRGFKSFPDPTEVNFEPGVSIVVGPNGSGKSNVADAIVWASGSLSRSQLRAEKPEDVMYSGSDSRNAAEFCEVELCFDNTDGNDSIPYSELSIMRRLHRGGEGEYLINRNPVRRLDVLELLADVGLGGEMHAIISQGRVDAVLASSPMERRALIEEAAGLGAFKQRRRRAELKLKRVRVDVDRACDLEAEVRKHLRPLALQASAAERAEKLKQEIASHEAKLWNSELAILNHQVSEIEARQDTALLEKQGIDKKLESLLKKRENAEVALQQAAINHEKSIAALYRLRSVLERLEVRRESATELSTSLREEHDHLAQLALLPRETEPFDELERLEEEARICAEKSRKSLDERGRLEQEADLASERLKALEASLSELEGLSPAARVFAGEGCDLALSMLDVDEGYERAVAAALFWRGSAVLVREVKEAVELLERSRSEGLGTLAVVLDSLEDCCSSIEAPSGATPLTDHVRGREGSDQVMRFLKNVWLLPLEELGAISTGVGVTIDGHCFDADRGDLWYEGETAKSVLMSLKTRQSNLKKEVAVLLSRVAVVGKEAAVLCDNERKVRERLTLARAAVAKSPRPVGPEVLERISLLVELSSRLVREIEQVGYQSCDLDAPLKERVDAGSAKTTELGQELRQLGEQEAVLRRQSSDAQERISTIEVENVQFGIRRDELCSKLGDNVEEIKLDREETEEVASKISRFYRRLEGIGQVNPLAAEDHAREKERLIEITEQRKDLQESVNELELLCHDLSEAVDRRFSETFSAVQDHFKEVSSTLFPGGEGWLRLTEGEGIEGEDLGVEVHLRPAGKRITRLSLLSGGEKALGALSFLFALFLARPCPFYLLDEVEAALDDTNIGRFVELLRQYADRAQFVVVTHQKMTMEAADILYGVTMGPDGVSHIVSRRVQEAAPEVEAA